MFIKYQYKKVTCLLWINLVFAGCGNFANKENGGKRDVRIVCVSKHLAELLFALGKGHNIVARDLTSTYPIALNYCPILVTIVC
ncbi:MAG: hypothetical protein H7211_14070 [Aquabacterium sp.]|nr:hypothetical protein [Ferruginibacter sp.]